MSLSTLVSGLKNKERDLPVEAQVSSLNQGTPESAVIHIDPAKTLDNPFQPRVFRNTSADSELALSVASSGIHQPILVTPPNAEGFYTVVAGHRRRDAALKAKTQCPAIERSFSVDEMEQIATIENIQRDNMAMADEVKAVARLATKHTNKGVAKLLGKSAGYVSKAIKMSQATGALADLLSARQSTDASAFYELVLLHDKAPKVASAIASRWVKDPEQSLSLRQQVIKAKKALIQVGAITAMEKTPDAALSLQSEEPEESVEEFPGHLTQITPRGFSVHQSCEATPSLEFTLDDQTIFTVNLAHISWRSFRDAINR